jgi:catechol 2,3-dioxygenase
VIPPGTSIGKVRLRVADIDALSEFYERVVGLRGLDRDGDLVRLGPEADEPLVELASAPTADPPPSFSTGLFHLAILVPDRAELARSLRRVIENGWRLTGASDHLVSEALYLRDPEGNGIEIYRDRPRDEWAMREGQIEMATLPLDLEDLLSELGAGDAEPPGPMPEGTRIGHVHLQVTDLAPAEAFYEGTLGFDVTVRSYPGALFLSAGGYHHHIGVNTWLSAGAPAPQEGALGLEHFEVTVPGRAERELVRDPDGIELVLSGGG